jgi:hypothetical protein
VTDVGTSPPRPDPTNRSLKLARTLLWWFCIGFLLCLLVPMRYTALKVGLVAFGMGAWAVALFLCRATVVGRTVCAIIAAAVAGILLFLLLPGRPYDKNVLRSEYIRSLMSYRGTPYVWGGGNRFGIDCSGLVERALVDAYLKRAAITANPGLAREAVSLWWYNRSARALGEGYRGDTLLLREVRELNTADYSAIEPGDLAVLSDGVHVMAYLGSQTWIEADPLSMRTITARVPRNADIYFSMHARIMRWRSLE